MAPTNGFQPLYFILLLPIVALGHGSLLFPIHASGVLLAVWAAGTAAVLRALLLRLAGPVVALFGLLLWAVCPYFILMSVNGLETGPAMFFTLLVPLLYLSWFRGDEPAGAKRAITFGAVCGLAVLARLDLLLLVAAVAAEAVLRGLRRPRRALAIPALALAGALGVWLPWALVSHAQTGHWIPLSGAASREIALNFGWLNLQPVWSSVGPDKLLFDPRHVPAAFTLDVATKLAVVFLFEHPLLGPLRANVLVGPWAELDDYVPYRLLLANPALFAALTIAVGAAVTAVAWRRARARVSAVEARDERRVSLRRLVVVFLLLVAVGYSVYAPTHWYFNRYLAGPILLTTAYLLVDSPRPSYARSAAAPQSRWLRWRSPGTQLAQWRFFTRLRWSDTPPGGFLATWQTLGSRLAPEARVGAFQAGIYGWFSGATSSTWTARSTRTPPAQCATERLHEYVRRQGIRYVLDGQQCSMRSARATRRRNGHIPRRLPGTRAAAASSCSRWSVAIDRRRGAERDPRRGDDRHRRRGVRPRRPHLVGLLRHRRRTPAHRRGHRMARPDGHRPARALAHRNPPVARIAVRAGPVPGGNAVRRRSCATCCTRAPDTNPT